MEHLLKLKCAHSPLNLRILSSTSVPYTHDDASAKFSTNSHKTDYSAEGNAAHPVGCDSPLQIVMAIWHSFLNLNLLGPVWQPAAYYNGCLVLFKFFKKCAKRPILSAAGCHTRSDH
jgi:hypothetical protein